RFHVAQQLESAGVTPRHDDAPTRIELSVGAIDRVQRSRRSNRADLEAAADTNIRTGIDHSVFTRSQPLPHDVLLRPCVEDFAGRSGNAALEHEAGGFAHFLDFFFLARNSSSRASRRSLQNFS